MGGRIEPAVPLMVAVSPWGPNVCGVVCCFCWTGIEMPRVLVTFQQHAAKWFVVFVGVSRTISQSFAKCFIVFVGVSRTISQDHVKWFIVFVGVSRTISPGPSELGGNLRNPLRRSSGLPKSPGVPSQCPG